MTADSNALDLVFARPDASSNASHGVMTSPLSCAPFQSPSNDLPRSESFANGVAQ